MSVPALQQLTARSTEFDRHVPELDGLRGLAVILVLGWHFTGAMMDRSAGALQDAIHAATIFGRTGVDLFFVLSGFLIIGILIDHRQTPGLFRSFYARRLARIHPPYLLLIALYWLCYLITGPNYAFNTEPSFAVQLASQLTFTWNWLMAWYDTGVAAGFSVSWSVAIEEWFYLLFPALIVFTPARTLPLLLASIAICSATGRAMVHITLPDHTLAPYVLTPLRLDGLCAGGLLAYAYRNRKIWQMILDRRRDLWRALIVGAASVPVLIAASRPALMWHMSLWGHTYLAVVATLALTGVLIFEGERRLRLLRSRAFIKAGALSYSLYLFHPLVISFCFVLAGERELITSVDTAALALAALLLSVVLSWVSHDWVEIPLRAYSRSRFRYSPNGESRRGEMRNLAET